MLRTMVIASVAASAAGSLAAEENPMNPFAELLEMSQNEKKGLVFYVGGQTIPGIVTKQNLPHTVEVRNQTHSRILIRMERVDAVAMS